MPGYNPRPVSMPTLYAVACLEKSFRCFYRPDDLPIHYTNRSLSLLESELTQGFPARDRPDLVEILMVSQISSPIPSGLTKRTFIGEPSLTLITHEDFYCNRRYAAATSRPAGGLAAQSGNILFQVCLVSSPQTL